MQYCHWIIKQVYFPRATYRCVCLFYFSSSLRLECPRIAVRRFIISLWRDMPSHSKTTLTETDRRNSCTADGPQSCFRWLLRLNIIKLDEILPISPMQLWKCRVGNLKDLVFIKVSILNTVFTSISEKLHVFLYHRSTLRDPLISSGLYY